MSFGNLSLRRNSTRISEATSIPSNGANTFAIGFAISNSDNFTLDIVANGPSITDVSWAEPADGDTTVTVTFAQNGSDSATIIATQEFAAHTLVRGVRVASEYGNS